MLLLCGNIRANVGTQSKKPDPEDVSAKDEELKFRVDPELRRQAEEKANTHGWSLSSVMRALLRLWVQEDVVSAADVGAEKKRTPRKSRKKAKKE